MNTKSKIQLISEQIENKERFKNDIESILEKYTVEDNIFISKNGVTLSVINGYFVPNTQYDSLTEAMSDFINNFTIRIEKDKFTTGTVYEYLSECPEGSKVFDINTEKYVY